MSFMSWITPAASGQMDAMCDRSPDPPTRVIFDSRPDARIAADVAAYNAAYSGEMLRQIAKQTRG